MSQSRSALEVVEAYRDYSPSVGVKEVINSALRHVPPTYLTGLRRVVLTNARALSRDQRRQKVWSRTRKVRLAESLGSYHQEWKGESAWIEILVDNVLESVPRAMLKVPIFRQVLIASVLHHEIGHHIHATRRPEFGEREDIADRWADKLTTDFVRREYWFLLLLFTPFRLLRRLLKFAKKAISRSHKRANSHPN